MLLKIVTLFISPLNELHALSFYKPLILVSTYPSFRRARSGAHALGQYNRMCVYCSVLVRCSTHQVLNRFTMQVIVNLQIFNLLFTIFFFFNFSSFGPENSLWYHCFVLCMLFVINPQHMRRGVIYSHAVPSLPMKFFLKCGFSVCNLHMYGCIADTSYCSLLCSHAKLANLASIPWKLKWDASHSISIR